MVLEYVFGAGILAFLFLYFAFKLDKKHFILQITLLLFSVILMLLVAKGAMDGKVQCDNMLMNQTVTGNTTTYQYDKVCYTEIANTGLYSFRTMGIFATLFYLYVLFYIVLEVYDIRKIMGGRK